MMTTRLRSLLVATSSIAVCFLPAIIGSRFVPGQWYQELAKPSLTPPGWVFPIAWSALYLMMGLALWLILVARPFNRIFAPLLVFGAQLLLNGLWSWLFFGLHKPGIALVDIVLLWLLIVLCILFFWRIKPLAGALLVPYAMWVGFATWLNYGLWRLNP